MKYGARLASAIESIKVNDLSTKTSKLSETVRLNEDNNVGLNKAKYNFDLENSKDIGSNEKGSVQLSDFEGAIEIKVSL